MTTTFKIEHKGEIRRLSIADEKISFSELVNTCKQIFERLPEKFAFKYTDDEADEITVSSDKELLEAIRLLKTLKTPTLKFKVAPIKEKRKPEEKSKSENNNNNRDLFDLADSIAQKFPFLEVSLETPDGRPVHRACPFFPKEGEAEERTPRFFRAFCDNCKCKIPFPGSRFKCNSCPDFDLCGKCHATKDVHDPNHKFVEIKHPRDILHNALCDSCGNFIVGDRHKCAACPDFDLCSTCRAKPGVHPEDHKFEKMERPIRRCPRFNRSFQPAKVSVPEVKKEEAVPVVNKPVEKKEEVKPVEVKKEEVKKEEPKKEEVKPVEVKKEEVKEEKKEAVPVIDPFTAKLNQLQDMGFTNREKNINLLMKHKGDLVSVVKDLLA